MTPRGFGGSTVTAPTYFWPVFDTGFNLMQLNAAQRSVVNRQCPQPPTGNISGANSLPSVLTVAGVNGQLHALTQSSFGPGALATDKPDVASFGGFSGSGIGTHVNDNGTSAAAGVAAGLVAALRSKFKGTSRLPNSTKRYSTVR